MSERARRNSRRAPRWGAFLAVVAVALLAPDARAGCGDYVVIVSPTGATAADSPTPAHPPEPCHGPSCSRHRDPIPLAPAAPATPPVEQAVRAPHEPVPPAAGVGPAFTSPLAFDPATRPFRPERPPRS
ncbi:hypothetical protein [Urbifossiella limnaea]|uniref:hypothetical protein n=1 Tax=Urbifossiella limnaea TaxID=2528023 RepID=UPI0011A12F91|nr:hypothetical protein [Urbifossiella limnaea]